MRNLSSDDFNLLLAYDRIEPFGPVRDDLRMGFAVSAYFNSKSRDAHFTPSDFMPFTQREPEEPQTIEQQVAVMMQVTEYQKAIEASG